MKNILRMAAIVVLASAVNVRAADIPFTDGDMDYPSGTVHEKKAAAEELGGGSGEPGRAEAEKKEAAPKSRAETETEAELWQDRGGE